MSDDTKAKAEPKTKVEILRGYQPMTEGAEFLREGAIAELPAREANKLIRAHIATVPAEAGDGQPA